MSLWSIDVHQWMRNFLASSLLLSGDRLDLFFERCTRWIVELECFDSCLDSLGLVGQTRPSFSSLSSKKTFYPSTRSKKRMHWCMTETKSWRVLNVEARRLRMKEMSGRVRVQYGRPPIPKDLRLQAHSLFCRMIPNSCFHMTLSTQFDSKRTKGQNRSQKERVADSDSTF